MIAYYVAPGLDDLAKFPKKKSQEQLDQIERIVAVEQGQQIADIRAKGRTRTRVIARQIIFFLARKHTTLTYKEIGERFGVLDHTTVLHGVRTLEDLMPIYPDIRSTVTRIEQLYLNAK